MTKPVLIACSSDRGLCGGIHSSVSKMTKKLAKQIPDSKIAVLGVKARSKLAHDSAAKFAISFDGVCKFTASWYESATIADAILNLKLPADGMQIIYNKFTSVIAFETESWKIPALKTLTDSRNNN